MKEKIDYLEEENKLTRRLFDLDEVILFQMRHDVEIVILPDWQYMCYIDGKGFGLGLTMLGALVNGVKQYKNVEN